MWRLGEEKDGKVTWNGEVSLEGVAYYYDPGVTPEAEIIRCHGKQSIYLNLLDTVPEA